MLRNQTRHALGRTESVLASLGTGGTLPGSGWLALPLWSILWARIWVLVLEPSLALPAGQFGSVPLCASCSVSVCCCFLGRRRGPLRFLSLSFFKPAGYQATVRVWKDSLLEWLEGVLRQECWEFLCQVLWLLCKGRSPSSALLPSTKVWPWVGSSNR